MTPDTTRRLHIELEALVTLLYGDCLNIRDANELMREAYRRAKNAQDLIGISILSDTAPVPDRTISPHVQENHMANQLERIAQELRAATQNMAWSPDGPAAVMIRVAQLHEWANRIEKINTHQKRDGLAAD